MSRSVCSGSTVPSETKAAATATVEMSSGEAASPSTTTTSSSAKSSSTEASPIHSKEKVTEIHTTHATHAVHPIFIFAEIVSTFLLWVRQNAICFRDNFELFLVATLWQHKLHSGCYTRRLHTLSGWCVKLSFLKAFLISKSEASLETLNNMSADSPLE